MVVNRRRRVLFVCVWATASSSLVDSFSSRYEYQRSRLSRETVANELGTRSRLDAGNTQYLEQSQADFTIAYLNEHHRNDVLKPFVLAFTEVGELSVSKNMWMGGSYVLEDSELSEITRDSLIIDATIQESGKSSKQLVEVSLDSSPVKGMKKKFMELPPVDGATLERSCELPIDDFVRRMVRLCNQAKAYSATGKMIQLGVQLGGKGAGKLKDNMFLNQVPHNRYVRSYFYEMAADAALEAVVLCSSGVISNRMKLQVMFPEMNPQMDSYRIGTLLELTRTIAIRLAEQNLRVRVCVQGSIGQGIFTAIPKQLNGVATILQRMDWQSGEGEENEGMVGDFVNFGHIGKEHVVNFKKGEGDEADTQQDDVFILICPQNMQGIESSIIPYLLEMTEAVGDRPIILINPDLVDKASSQGQQSVRGRQERIDFANSFKTIFQFQNIYYSGTSYFPILGASTLFGPEEMWVSHQRRDLKGGKGEVYVPVYASESMPDSEVLMSTFSQ